MPDPDVIISYRRSDSEREATRIRKRLEQEIGEGRVFRDLDSISLSEDFEARIDDALDKSKLLIAIIGPGWVDTQAEDGTRRIDDPFDFVRMEIVGALDRKLRIVPVFVRDASMPDELALPTDIRALVKASGAPLPNDNFNRANARLAKEIAKLLASKADHAAEPPARAPHDEPDRTQAATPVAAPGVSPVAAQIAASGAASPQQPARRTAWIALLAGLAIGIGVTMVLASLGIVGDVEDVEGLRVQLEQERFARSAAEKATRRAERALTAAPAAGAIDEIKKQLSASQQRVTKLEADLKASRSTLERERASAGSTSAVVSELNAEIARLEAELSRARTSAGTIRMPEMVTIRPGSFDMGSAEDEKGHSKEESPRHRVTIRKPFELAAHEVTRDEFARFVEATGHTTAVKGEERCWLWENSKTVTKVGRSWRDPGFKQAGTHPVVCVSADDAVAYTAWLSKQTGQRFRLPSEAEWEYAARAGTTTRYSFGDGSAELGDYAWHRGNSGGGTHEVGTKKPNGWSLYDMHGNAGEWTQDCYHKNYEKAPTDGSAWQAENAGNCGTRIYRGGSWHNSWSYTRSAHRNWDGRSKRNIYAGFRLARDP